MADVAKYLLVAVNDEGEHDIIYVSNERGGELGARERASDANIVVYILEAKP